jgi:Cytochrome c7 and related cytochrome c
MNGDRVEHERDPRHKNRESPASERRRKRRREIVLAAAALATLGIILPIATNDGRRAIPPFSSFAAGEPIAGASEGVASGVFAPSHRSVLGALRDFFDLYSTPVQPIAFNHQLHLERGMKCVACHAGVTQGPEAGIPSVTFCMACHQVIAAKKPEIKKLAAYAAKGQEPPWQPVYWFYPAAHVRFWHAPHIRAGVGCAQCHGDLSQQTVAVRAKNLNMRFCLDCHKANQVSVDCTTCHD